MDVQDMIMMLLGSAQNDPSILSNLVEHPYSTIRGVTGMQDISREQASQVVVGTAAAARGRRMDTNMLSGFASAMLGQSDNSVHSMANMLLGSGHSAGFDVSQGVGGDILSNLMGLLMGDGGQQYYDYGQQPMEPPAGRPPMGPPMGQSPRQQQQAVARQQQQASAQRQQQAYNTGYEEGYEAAMADARRQNAYDRNYQQPGAGGFGMGDFGMGGFDMNSLGNMDFGSLANLLLGGL